MHEGLCLARLETTVQCLFGMSSVDWAHSRQKPQVLNQTSNLRHTCLRSRPSGEQNLCPSTRDPRSNLYKDPQFGQALQSTCPDWTIKTHIPQDTQIESHSVRPPSPCRFTPSCGQLPNAVHPLVAPAVPDVWHTEPSVNPWNFAWDKGAPDELRQFLLEVLLTPSQTATHSSSSEWQRQNLSVPAPAPDSPSKAASPVRLPEASRSKELSAAVVESTAAPVSSEPSSVSLDTITDRSMGSSAATSTAAFSHAPGAQQTSAAEASLQTLSSRKRSREGSEQTDAQTAPVTDVLPTQPATGRPAKKTKRSTGSKSAIPALSSSEISQAAKDGVVFAKYARFAPWPAQVLVPSEQQISELGPPSEGHCFVIFFGQGNYQYVSLDKVVSFDIGWSRYKSGKSSLDAAVKEAIAYLKAQVAG